MRYFSTRDNLRAESIDFATAVLHGLAPDGGLYMPWQIPVLDFTKVKKIWADDLGALAAFMLQPFVHDAFDNHTLTAICREAFNFPLPLVKLSHNLYILELFHGPTLAFKDFGARFMARIFGELSKSMRKEIRVLVATSGDTGSAVAAGFFHVTGIKVFILYPKGRVSSIQQKQLTTWGDNIIALEIDGSFDDCQRLVKQLLSDSAKDKDFIVTSANSINLARLLPQMVYYASASLRLQSDNLIFSVPSGNFGNLFAGLLAAAMGVPVMHFVAATNINDVVPKYLQSGQYEPRPSIRTLSNAMDVGNPSNFERMFALFGHNHHRITSSLSGIGFTDKQTLAGMRELFEKYAYISDPHGTIGYLGAKHFARNFPEATFVFLETAHPSKFPDIVKQAIGREPEIPDRLLAFYNRDEKQIVVPNDFKQLQEMVFGA